MRSAFSYPLPGYLCLLDSCAWASLLSIFTFHPHTPKTYFFNRLCIVDVGDDLLGNWVHNCVKFWLNTRNLLWIKNFRLEHSCIPAKMAKMWILSGQLPPWLATGAGHGPDGSEPYQYRWVNVVWAPCCCNCVMGCCRVLVVFHLPLVAHDSHILYLGLGLLRTRLLGLCCTSAFPLIFPQLRKGPL